MPKYNYLGYQHSLLYFQKNPLAFLVLLMEEYTLTWKGNLSYAIKPDLHINKN